MLAILPISVPKSQPTIIDVISIVIMSEGNRNDTEYHTIIKYVHII